MEEGEEEEEEEEEENNKKRRRRKWGEEREQDEDEEEKEADAKDGEGSGGQRTAKEYEHDGKFVLLLRFGSVLEASWCHRGVFLGSFWKPPWALSGLSWRPWERRRRQDQVITAYVFLCFGGILHACCTIAVPS